MAMTEVEVELKMRPELLERQAFLARPRKGEGIITTALPGAGNPFGRSGSLVRPGG
jgi:hypothetical protein